MRDSSKPRPKPPTKQPRARLPAAGSARDLPPEYASLLAELKQRIREERLRVVLAANAAMVLLYWDIGRAILKRQQREGWGAKVIDRLSADLRREFPEMQGLSPRNLKYMRAFAAAWPERQIVQQVAAQIPWFHNCVMLDKLDHPEARFWYARMACEEGWSRNVLVHGYFDIDTEIVCEAASRDALALRPRIEQLLQSLEGRREARSECWHAASRGHETRYPHRNQPEGAWDGW